MKLLKTISSTYEFNGGGRGARIRQPSRQGGKRQPSRAPPTPKWRGGWWPEGGGRAAQSATSMLHIGSPGGGGQWGWWHGARRSGFVVAPVDRVMEKAAGRPAGGSTLAAVEIRQPGRQGGKRQPSRAPSTLEWHGGRWPEGGARVARSATFMRRVGSPGGGGQ